MKLSPRMWRLWVGGEALITCFKNFSFYLSSMKFKKQKTEVLGGFFFLCQLKSQPAEITGFAMTVSSLPINGMESFPINLNICFYFLVLNHEVTGCSGSLLCWQLSLSFPRQGEAYGNLGYIHIYAKERRVNEKLCLRVAFLYTTVTAEFLKKSG